MGHPRNIQDCDIRALADVFVEALFDFGLVLHNLSVIYVLAPNDEIEQFWSLGRPYADSGVDITHFRVTYHDWTQNDLQYIRSIAPHVPVL